VSEAFFVACARHQRRCRASVLQIQLVRRRTSCPITRSSRQAMSCCSRG
jgi:hypothetical protein